LLHAARVVQAHVQQPEKQARTLLHGELETGSITEKLNLKYIANTSLKAVCAYACVLHVMLYHMIVLQKMCLEVEKYV
jgi:hypothetical protein